MKQRPRAAAAAGVARPARPRLEALEGRYAPSAAPVVLLPGHLSAIVGRQANAQSTAQPDGTPVSLTAATGLPFTLVLTSSPAAAGTPDHASVDWGDGTRSTAAVTPTPGGGFQVATETTFLRAGAFTFTVTAHSAGGDAPLLTGTLNVLAAPPPASYVADGMECAAWHDSGIPLSTVRVQFYPLCGSVVASGATDTTGFIPWTQHSPGGGGPGIDPHVSGGGSARPPGGQGVPGSAAAIAVAGVGTPPAAVPFLSVPPAPGAPTPAASLVPEYLRVSAPARLPLRIPPARPLVPEVRLSGMAAEPAPVPSTSVTGVGRAGGSAEVEVPSPAAASVAAVPGDIGAGVDLAAADFLFSPAAGGPAAAGTAPAPPADPPPDSSEEGARPGRNWLGVWSAVSCCVLKLFADHFVPIRGEKSQKIRPGL